MHKGCICYLVLFCCFSCVDYTPKPKGYLRIEPAVPQYGLFTETGLPYGFELSHLATVQLPLTGQPAGEINIVYPSLKATIYCSYLPITAQSFAEADYESRTLLLRQVKQADISEKAYSNPEANVYASLFEIRGEAPSPIQFVVTDSVSHFFRGALYYDNYGTADSIAPVTSYLRNDIVELIQTFYWKR